MQSLKSFFTGIRLWYERDFNESLYWHLRISTMLTGGVKRSIAVVLCRRMEAKKCSTTGTGPIGNCCMMAAPLVLPHGLFGIVIARNVRIGKRVAIFQHVTIAESNKNKKTIIEDDVMIGAGAIILNNAHIGKGAKIGANAVVLHDVPAYATAVGNPARIILK